MNYVVRSKKIVHSSDTVYHTKPVMERVKVTGRFICINRQTGEEECGITYSNGTVYVGADVWRKLNRADFCEYPFCKYASLQEVQKYYMIRKSFKAYYKAKGGNNDD